jgi:hypothetical protein
MGVPVTAPPAPDSKVVALGVALDESVQDGLAVVLRFGGGHPVSVRLHTEWQQMRRLFPPAFEHSGPRAALPFCD